MRIRGDGTVGTPLCQPLLFPLLYALVVVAVVSLGFSAQTGAARGTTSPTPAAKVVDGVPLVPFSASQRAQCQKFADQMKRRVPCPGLVPSPIPVTTLPSSGPCLGVVGENACGPAVIQRSRSFLEMSQSNFQVPPGYVGVTFQQYNGAVVPMRSISGGPLGHFVFMTGSDLQSVVVGTKPSRVSGAAARLYQCPETSNGPATFQLYMGHELLVWNDGGMTAEVSFHGLSQINADLDVAVADATVLVSPKAR
jgi:hypothetical protein